MSQTVQFSTSIIANMSAAIAKLNQDLATPGILSSVLQADVVAYYQAQEGVRAYAALAAEVAGNTGFNGAVANQNVEDYYGTTNFTAEQIAIATSLALEDWSQIQNNNYDIPTIVQDDQEHITVFGNLGIPITYWSGTPFAVVDANWIGSLETAAEAQVGQPALFSALPVSQIAVSFGNLVDAAVKTDINNPGQIYNTTFFLEEMSDFASLSQIGNGLITTGVNFIANSAQQFLQYLENEGITLLNSVPSLSLSIGGVLSSLSSSDGLSMNVNIGALESSIQDEGGNITKFTTFSETLSNQGTVAQETLYNNNTGNWLSVLPDLDAGGDTQNISFLGASGTLEINNPSVYAGTISSIIPGDTIDLLGISATDATLGTNNALTVNEAGSGTLILDLDPSQNFVGLMFDVNPDGSGGSYISPTGELVGVVSAATNEIQTVDPTTGAVTQTGSAISGLSGVEVSDEVALNGNLYLLGSVGRNGNVLYTVDIQTGQLLNSAPTTITSLVADDLTGKLVGVANNEILTVDPTTGAVTQIGSSISGLLAADTRLGAVGDADGKLYFVGDTAGGSLLYAVDVQTGQVLNTAPNNIIDDFVVDSVTGQLFSISPNEISTVDPTTGVVTQIGPSIPGLLGVNYADMVAEGGQLYFLGNTATGDMLYTVDSQTGQVLSVVSSSVAEFVANETSVTCFARDTNITTDDGEVAVQDLREGDLVRATFAGPTRIKWIGHRRVDCSRHPDPRKVWPVRVSAGAFDECLPCRDLWLSPDHAVFVDDVLIPIKHLVNGMTIEQVPLDEVTYYHIELNQHDVLLAEGLPTESYLDTGDRSKFSNGGGPIALHPDFSVRMWEAKGCAPLVVTGPALISVRTRLLQRAAQLAVETDRQRPAIQKSRAA